jgi:hypothetical protein
VVKGGSAIGDWSPLLSHQRRTIPNPSVIEIKTLKQYLHLRYSLVWQETIATYKEMVSAEGWDVKAEFIIPEINKLPVQVSLSRTFVITSNR